MENTADKKRFQILNEKFGNQQLLKLYDSKTKEYVGILPETGGMLYSMELLIGNKLIPVLDYYQSESELKKDLATSFKGSNLFPFPNRIDSGKYEFEGNKYQLFVNFPQENNAIHGLIFDKPFEVIETKNSDVAASAKLRYSSKGNFQGYPFRFELDVDFIFEENKGLTVSTTFANSDNKTIPVADGWHPYFQLQSKVDELLFSFPSEKTYEVNDRLIPSGKSIDYKLFNSQKQVKDTTYDTCFGLNEKEGTALITIYDPALQGGVSIWQETGKDKFNYLQIYTPPTRKTIAIEPMTCIPNSLNNKVGLISLLPGKKINVNWGISKMVK